MVLSILLAILVFGLIIVVHETGHFVAARLTGVTVLEFAVGMGPKLYKRKMKSGTLFTIRAFPIGGFCKMLGEDESNDDPGAFNNKKVWQRFFISVSGALMNFLLALIAALLLVSMRGYTLPKIMEITPGSAAEAAGLMSGDTIVKIDDMKVNLFEDAVFKINIDGRDKPMDIYVKRNGETLKFTLTPTYDEEEERYKVGFGSRKTIGLIEGDPHDLIGQGITTRAGFIDTAKYGVYTVGYYLKITVVSITKLFTFQLGLDKLSGPIGITGMINDNVSQITDNSDPQNALSLGQKVEQIFALVLFLCAAMSANIGIFNLLPLPALDGGRCVFLIVEAIRGKPLDPNKEGLVHFVGFVLLMILAVLVMVSDVLKF